MNAQFRPRLLASTLLMGVAALASPAYAAQPQDEDTQENAVDVTIDPDAADAEGTETIVVTGSRIPRRDLTSTSPLAVVQDEEFKLSGTVNVEQVINTLPQVLPGLTSFSNNPGNGAATVNLRGLGSTRTLILVNGRRYIFFDTNQVVDVNNIPAFLIDSVDVITGGASAVYGSDAISGVINFRLQEDLVGITTGGGFRITERGDGVRKNLFLALGSEFADNRGHVTAFGEYFERKPVFQSAREFSRNTFIEPVFVGGSGLDFVRFGSTTIPEGRISAPGSQFIPAGNGLPALALPRGGPELTGLGRIFDTPGGASRRFVNPDDAFNFAPDNFLQLPQERFLLGGYGEYEISPAISAFGEVTFINNRVEQELAPTPVTGSFQVNIAQQQPFLSAADFALLQQLDANEAAINAARVARGLSPNLPGPGTVQLSVFRRIRETGPRNSFDERNAFRVLGGVKGPAFGLGDWNYEAYYLYARTRNANVQQGNISRSAFQAGLNGSATPINVFGPGSLDQTAVDQITIQAQNNDISTLQVANAALAGSLGNFGLGGQNIGAAVGVEYRKVASQFIPDTALSSGDVIGFNAGDATSGQYNVKEAFVELRVPIIADRPFFNRLDVSGAYRYSDYSLDNVGRVHAYAAGAEFAPVRDITFRGQYQRAVRAPNVGELFGGQSIGFPPATDPCAQASAATNPTIRALCIATGVPAALVGQSSVQPNAQIQGVFGGNPDLQEETSDTFTLGAVFRPSFIPRLAITVDGFDITVEDTISVLGGGLNNTLNLCFNEIQDINSIFCQAIVRDPDTGVIGGDFSPAILNANIGKLETRGVDLQVDYDVPVGFSLTGNARSRLGFFFLGTYLDKFDVTPVADLPDIVDECAGRFGAICGEPRPKYKWAARVSYIDGPTTVSLRWNHLGKVRDDDDETEFRTEKIDAFNYFDLALSFNVNDNYTFAVGARNIFDKQPPIVGLINAEQANTYPSTYDVLGRDYFATVNLRF
jgi:outer membrane receptor protein involved in Fe transport